MFAIKSKSSEGNHWIHLSIQPLIGSGYLTTHSINCKVPLSVCVEGVSEIVLDFRAVQVSGRDFRHPLARRAVFWNSGLVN